MVPSALQFVQTRSWRLGHSTQFLLRMRIRTIQDENMGDKLSTHRHRIWKKRIQISASASKIIPQPNGWVWTVTNARLRKCIDSISILISTSMLSSLLHSLTPYPELVSEILSEGCFASLRHCRVGIAHSHRVWHYPHTHQISMLSISITREAHRTFHQMTNWKLFIMLDEQ